MVISNQKSAIFVTIGFFLSKAFRFQTNVCNRCYDLLMMCMNVSDISILNIKGFDYTVILAGLAKMRP